MKKILYLITKGVWGGAQKYVFDLATSLPQDKYEVLVVHGEGRILNRKLREHGIRTEEIKKMGRDLNIFWEAISLFEIFKILFQERPDVVHVNSSKAGGLGAFVARVYQFLTLNFDLKIIFTVHGWAFNEPRFNNFITKFFSWLTVLFSTKTIVISKENYKQGIKFPLVSKKFSLIHNGVKEIDFKDRNSTRKFISDLTGAPEDMVWLITISELHKNKGLEHLIRAVSYLKKKPAVFIISDGEERENLERLIEKLNLKNIYLMGFLENAKIYLKAFDIFTLTSIKEGLPFVLLEAGLAAMPVLGSDIPGINDILDSKTGVLTEKENPKDIALKIESMLNNNDKMAQLGHKLRQKVLEKFSIERMLKETASLY